MPKESYQPEMPNREYEALYGNRLKQLIALYERAGVDLRIVGSIGRAASIGVPVTNFRDEYGKLRDVDFVVVSPADPSLLDQLLDEAVRRTWPIQAEEHFKGQIIIGTDSAVIRYKKLTREIDPSVFARFDGHLMGVTIPTFHPQTLLYLTGLSGFMRPKDFYNMTQFARDIENIPTRLPDTLFEPFNDLSREREQTYRIDELMGRLRWFYHTNVPVPVRNSLSRISEPVWHAIKGD
jgi:hypothetical protein